MSLELEPPGGRWRTNGDGGVAPAPWEPHHAQKQALLVVDDDPGVQLSMRMVFERPYELFQAHSSEETFEVLRNHPVDCVLLDLRLGRESGIEILTRIGLEHPAVRVIVLTGYADVSAVNDSWRRGAFDFLEKPADTSELIDRVTAAMQAAPNSNGNGHTMQRGRPVDVDYDALARQLQSMATDVGALRVALQAQAAAMAPWVVVGGWVGKAARHVATRVVLALVAAGCVYLGYERALSWLPLK